MKVMISQPMRGKTNEQIKIERESIVKQLEQEGHEVVDTNINDFIEGESDNYAIKCLAKSIEMMSEVDAVIFMPGWVKARGCVLEHSVAHSYGKYIKYIEEKENEN